MNDHSRPIWVLGLPGGGTSAVAGMLHHLGVDMGDVDNATVAHEQFYKTYEDAGLEIVRDTPQEVCEAVIAHLRQRRDEATGPWGFKKPATAAALYVTGMLWDVIEEFEPQFLCVYRGWWECIEGNRRRHPEWSDEHWRNSCRLLSDMSVVHELIMQKHGFAFASVDYEWVLDDPISVCRRIMGCRLGLRPAWTQILHATQFIKSYTEAKCQTA